MTTKIAPALFVPLIENAFKFAVFGNDLPGIEILLSSEKGIIQFEISNKYVNYSKNSEKADSGFGIINLKKRLDLTYPGRYNLILEPGELIYRAKLTIDTNGD